MKGHTILITGGATGIGLALAKRLAADNTIIVCGRREEKLKETGFPYYVCDVGNEAQRIALVQTVLREHPKLDVLMNNAGIQRRMRLTDHEHWKETQSEIGINLEAPIHLCQLFIPHLEKQKGAAIVNVTSGLAFVPMSIAPIYCATKAALHSFTLSLRQQLLGKVTVIEIIPPAVNTDLSGPGLHTFGVPLDEFADSVISRLHAGELEIAYGFAEQSAKAAHTAFDEAFKRMNGAKG